MDKNSIKYLAYLLHKAKENKTEKAIVLIGAGVSVTAGIPLTDTIVRHIKMRFRKNPLIKNLRHSNNYYELMGALTTDQIRDLFHFYVTREKVKLNMANIYLAHLLKEGYVDYILTVNFDNLILKACSLSNFLPPVYDMSNVKSFNTTDIRTESVIYLHGQYFGQWLLNKKEELVKVEKEILTLFNTIKTRRTWIVVGYSGNDGVFESIKQLGSFSSDLFWVHKNFETAEQKVIDFINTPDINAHKIEGFHADSFFLNLHAELNKLYRTLNDPEILRKPFSLIKSFIQNVKAVALENETETSDDFNKLVNLKIEISNNRIEEAIEQFENKDTEEKLNFEILDASIKGDFTNQRANEFEKTINDENYIRAKSVLSIYCYNYGTVLYKLTELTKDEKLYLQSIEKFEKASELNPKNKKAYNNWGTALSELAKLTKDENLYLQSFEKYKKASELKPNDYSIYYNWGTALCELAELIKNEKLYLQSFAKYKKASELNPNDYSIYYNWGVALCKLAQLTEDEKLYLQSVEKHKKASELNPKNEEIYNNWGIALKQLAKLTQNEKLYRQSFEKYETASELNPKNENVYHNWGVALYQLAILKNDDTLFIEAEVVLEKGMQLHGKVYNLACLYSVMQNKIKALELLNQALANKEVTIKQVEGDEDWAHYKDDVDFINLLNSFK